MLFLGKCSFWAIKSNLSETLPQLRKLFIVESSLEVQGESLLYCAQSFLSIFFNSHKI